MRIIFLVSLLLLAFNASSQDVAKAAKADDASVVKSLIKDGADVNAVDAEGVSALAYAIINDNYSLVKKLLKADAAVDASVIIANAKSGNQKIFKLISNKGFNVNAKNEAGDTPIIHALKTDDLDLFSLFLLNNADLSIADSDGNTPLLLAIKKNLGEKYINAIIETKPNFDIKNTAGETPLSLALTNKNGVLMQKLIFAGADINVADKTGLTPFWFAMENNNFKLAETLIAKGANTSTIRNGVTPVLYALQKNDRSLLERLVGLGSDINVDGDSGQTPLMYTLKANRIDDYNYLLGQSSINVNAVNRFGYTLLDDAFKSAPVSTIKNLMAKGAKFGPAQDRNNITPLMYAIEYDKSELIYELMDKSSINKENYFGKTALILAIEKGNVNLVRELMNKGAFVNKTNYLQNCPLGYAVAHNKPEIVNMLLKKGADVNCRNRYDSTPLIEAAYYNLPIIASILIRAGADRNFRANYGDNAYDVAKKHENLEVLSVLSR